MKDILEYYGIFPEDTDDLIDALLREDPAEKTFTFCYCGHSMAEHQDDTSFCFNCNCMNFVSAECEEAGCK